MKPDLYDLMTAAGLALLFIGLSGFSLALAMAVVGLVLFALGLFLASRRARN